MASRDLLIVRYNEIALKGGNRSFFERSLKNNIGIRLRGTPIEKIERPWGRILVRLSDGADPEHAARRVSEVFGVTTVSAARSVTRDLDTIREAACDMMRLALERHPGEGEVTFRVSGHRSVKDFPLTSTELGQQVGGYLHENFSRLAVRLKGAAIDIGIEIRPDEALVFTESHRGPGGLPVSTLGHAVSMLSGGLDSPVASWLAMKRGLRLSFAYFHSPPFIGDASKQKVIDLAQILASFQHKTNLWVVPFSDIQLAIKKTADERYRTILYRRMMQRICDRLAEERRALAVVTGDCLGQVASQTLENLTVIDQASQRPILRPLIGFNKDETIELAKKIGTYEISIRPHPDCCTVFQPKSPQTRGKTQDVENAESSLDIESLVDQAVEATERLLIEPQ